MVTSNLFNNATGNGLQVEFYNFCSISQGSRDSDPAGHKFPLPLTAKISMPLWAGECSTGCRWTCRRTSRYVRRPEPPKHGQRVRCARLGHPTGSTVLCWAGTWSSDGFWAGLRSIHGQNRARWALKRAAQEKYDGNAARTQSTSGVTARRAEHGHSGPVDDMFRRLPSSNLNSDDQSSGSRSNPPSPKGHADFSCRRNHNGSVIVDY
ncbi:unnamed protein product [Linum tenue]|uniref:Uncharacterized protein n=1 Tax=Linum tenue TaxID=586396 RepID=A0AAV0Q304_9ROSI|nr:unnamed protein product [Linum tenue]